MKTLKIAIFLFAFASKIQAQDLIYKNQVDSIVSKIDLRSDKPVMFRSEFICDVKKKPWVNFKIKRSGVNIVYIERKYSTKDSSVFQTFYLNNNNLIFATETIKYHYKGGDVTWGGVYYLDNSQLKHYWTLGHGKSEDESWDPRAEVLSDYYLAQSVVTDFLKTMNGR